jgi:hypothetical protein
MLRARLHAFGIVLRLFFQGVALVPKKMRILQAAMPFWHMKGTKRIRRTCKKNARPGKRGRSCTRQDTRISRDVPAALTESSAAVTQGGYTSRCKLRTCLALCREAVSIPFDKSSVQVLFMG